MNFDTEKFITEIQKRPCIWDTSSKDYSDRKLKIQSWDEIVNIFKENDEMTRQEKNGLAESFQKRWKSIRGCFTRELNRQKSLKSGLGPGPRKSEYIFFKQLLFLQNVVALREPEATDPDVEATDPDLAKDLQHDRQVGSCPKRLKTKHKTAPEDDKFLEAFNKSIKSREQYEIGNQDEDQLFMLSLVSTLKKVPSPKKMATKIKIMSILEEATRAVSYIDETEPPPAPSRSYQPRHSTVRRETLPMMDYNTESLSGPPKYIKIEELMFNVSEDSSIVDD